MYKSVLIMFEIFSRKDLRDFKSEIASRASKTNAEKPFKKNNFWK